MTRGPKADLALPVFVDGSGRRRQVAILAGVAIGVGLLLSLGLVVAGLLGASPVAVPGLSGVDGGRRPAQVEQPGVGPSRTPTTRTRPATPGPTVGSRPAASTAPDPSPPGHPRGGPSRSHPGRAK